MTPFTPRARLTWRELCLSVLLVVLSYSAASSSSDDEGWNYSIMNPKGPRDWASHFPQCNVVNNKLQSPIRLKADETYYGYDLTEPVRFLNETPNGGSKPPFKLKNTGNKLVLTVGGDNFVSGGGLLQFDGADLRFRVAEVHFHFSVRDGSSVEHHLDDFEGSTPFEAQVYTFDHNKHASLQAALTGDGTKRVMGIAIPFRSALARNVRLEPVVERLQSVRFRGKETEVPAFDLNDLLPKKRTEFFVYDGSMPFPPCEDGVKWTVLANPNYVGRNQLHEFRSLVHRSTESTSEEGMAGNSRMTQRRMERYVIRSNAMETFNDAAALRCGRPGVLGVVVVGIFTTSRLSYFSLM